MWRTVRAVEDKVADETEARRGHRTIPAGVVRSAMGEATGTDAVEVEAEKLDMKRKRLPLKA